MKNKARFISNLILACIFLSINNLHAQEGPVDKTLSPYFVVKSESSEVDQLPLKSTKADVKIAGVIADVKVTQVYQNEGSSTLEAIYVFPASTQVAVYGMEMHIGNRIIKAKIKEKGEARQEYEEAKASGQRTSLLEQNRPNVFQMNVANILPGDKIEVVLSYTELLRPEDGQYEFVYPTVVGPRYSEKTASGASPDDLFLKTPFTKEGNAPTYDFDLNIWLSAGMPIQNVVCNTHKVNIEHEGIETAQIRLDAAETKGGNRDFILNYQLAGGKIQSGLLLYEHEDENFFLLTVQPPKRVLGNDIPPREYIFIVDVSGSMGGFPLDISKKLLRNLIANLRPTDKFNVLLFSGSSRFLAEESLYATHDNLNKAIDVIDNQRGGGGTRLLPAMKKALNFPRSEEALSRSMVVITDGYVAVEAEAFDLIRKNLNQSNLFSFGIGSGVNRHLIEGLANAGMGEPLIITQQKEAAEKAEKFRNYIQHPVLTQIKADFGDFDVYDVEPIAIPDVLAERPIIIFGKYKGEPKGNITIKGYSGKKKFKATFNVADSKADDRNSALRYLWAREKIKMLDDYNHLDHNPERIQEVTNLGLAYNLMTAYTSFIAVDEEIVKTEKGDFVQVKQALPLPQGVPNSAIGFDLAIEGKAGDGYFSFDSILQTVDNQYNNNNTCLSEVSRENITFILGEDKELSNPYYALAEKYYRTNEAGKTEHVVTSCRTFVDIRDYLEKNSPQNSQPWGTVNLVVHANEYTGLSIPVLPGGKRTTVQAIRKAMESGDLLPLSEDVADSQTQFLIQGCALGKNQQLLNTLTAAFGDHGFRVQSSENFVLYNENSATGEVEKSLAQSWYAFYKTGYRPGDIRLARQLQKHHPNANIDWRTALSSTIPKKEGDAYHYTFDVPVVWWVTYPNQSDLPNLESKEAQQKWLDKQPELKKTLEAFNIPLENFQWTFRKTTYLHEDGQEEPAIKAIGLCTVLCVLK